MWNWTVLSHWGRVTHICVSTLPFIVSAYGLSPGRRQAIIWTDAGILSIGPLKTKISVKMQSKFRYFHSKRWAPCWPHELCYLGQSMVDTIPVFELCHAKFCCVITDCIICSSWNIFQFFPWLVLAYMIYCKDASTVMNFLLWNHMSDDNGLAVVIWMGFRLVLWPTM